MNMLNTNVCINRWSLLILGMIFPVCAIAHINKHYTLNELVHSAYKRYPYAKQLTLTIKQKDESIKTIDTEWLPQLSASAKNSYQSEISSLNIPENIKKNFGINIAKGNKLQYQGELCLSQLIYDGGIARTQKKINELNGEIQAHQIESSMLQIENDIDNIFETILINKEQIKIIQFQQADLKLRKGDIASAIQNGISLKTDIQEIEADIIQLKQQETELQMALCQKYVQLSSYTQEPIDTTAVLELPQPIETIDRNYTRRPDYKLFNLQLRNDEWKLKKLNTEIVPQISFFADNYYGRPGLNMLDYSNHYSGIVGISLKWNINSLYNNNHQRKILIIDRSLVQSRQSLYEIEMNKEIDELSIDLTKNKKLAESDDDIVKIRSDVKEIAAIQLKNGSITLTNYLIKLNDESQAIINKSIHRIEYLMDGAKIKTLLNQNN